MNDARMTIRLPGASLEFARQYAGNMGMTVTELVVRYLDRLKEAFADNGIPASVRDVAGIVPKSVDAKKIYHKHLMERYA